MSESLMNDELVLRLRGMRPSVLDDEFQADSAQAIDLREQILAVDRVVTGASGVGSAAASAAASRHHRARGRTPRAVVGVAVLVLAVVASVLVLHSRDQAPSVQQASWTLTGHLSKISWQLQPTIGTDPFKLHCPSITTCYVAGFSFSPPSTDTAPQPHPVAEVTHDGGATWQESPLPPGGVTIGSITCPEVNTCMLSGRTQGNGPGSGVMFTTTNGGESWTSVPLPYPPGGFVPLLSCATILKCDSLREAPGPHGYVSDVTSDGGRTWRSTPMPGTFHGYALQCTASGYCIAGGQWRTASRINDLTQGYPVGALYSSDGGVTWHSGTFPKGPADGNVISELSCADQSHCTAISATIGRRPSTHVLETTDGGKSWSLSPGVSGSVYLEALSCPTDTDCWASGVPLRGQQGLIYSTNDGGRRWIRARVPTDHGSVLRLILDISCSARVHCVALANPSTSLSGPQVVISYGAGAS